MRRSKYPDILFILPPRNYPACEEGQGVCAHLMVIGSILLILVTLPFSLMFVVKVVQVITLSTSIMPFRSTLRATMQCD